MLLKCRIFNMQRKTEAYIHVRSRLWNATLVADYPRVDMVNIVSYAFIKVADDYGILQNRTDDRTFVSVKDRMLGKSPFANSCSSWVFLFHN